MAEITGVNSTSQQYNSSSNNVNSSSGEKNNSVWPSKTIRIQLTEEQIEYLRKLKLNPETASADQIAKALFDMPLKNTNTPDESKVSQPQAEAVQTSTKETVPVSANQANTETTSTEKSSNAVEKHSAETAQKAFSNEISKEGLKKFANNFDESKLHNLTTPERKKVLLEEFAIANVGEEEWKNFKLEKREAYIKDLENSITSKIPGYETMSKLQRKMVEAQAISYVEVMLENKMDVKDFMSLSQAERDALESKHIDEKSAEGARLNPREISIMLAEDKSIADNAIKEAGYENLDALQKDGKTLSQVMLDSLEAKIEKNGGDTTCLTHSELRNYKALQELKANTPDGNLEEVGNYSSDESNSALIALVHDEEFMQQIKGVKPQSKEYFQAIAQGFERQLGDLKGEERAAAIRNFRDGALTPAQKLDIMNSVAFLSEEDQKLFASLSNGNTVTTAGMIAEKTANANVQTSVTAEVAQGVIDGEIEESKALNYTRKFIPRFDKEAQGSATVEMNRTGSVKIQEAGIENMKEFDADAQKVVFDDVMTNKGITKDGQPIYKTKIQVKVASEIHTMSVENQTDFTKTAVNTGNEEVADAAIKTIHKQDKSVQTKSFSAARQAAENYDDDASIRLQSSLANEISLSDKSNQLEMHNEIMNSKYSEVQELAAKNIINYDPSVQVEAIDKVYQSKNSKAVQAVIENLNKMPPEVQKSEVVRLIGELVQSNDTTIGDLGSKIMSGNLTAFELRQLTPSQRREYYVKQFESASPAKKLEILKKLATSSSGIHQKTIYTIIARFSTPLLKAMVDGGLGKSMLKAGLPIDAVNKIINVMKTSTDNDVIQQIKELKIDSSFEKYFNEKEDEASRKKGITVPKEFGNDVKKIFAKRGMRTNALMDIKS